MSKRNGFTLIETMIALIIGSGLAISFAKYKIDEVELEKTKILSNDIEKVITGVDKRISIDGYDVNLWKNKNWEDHQIKDLIKKELQGTKSNCKTGEWIPRNNNLKLSLVDCDLFDKRLYDITITAQLKEENGYITKFITDYGFDSTNSFDKNIKTMKKAWILAKSDTKRPITGEKIFQYVDESGNQISFNKCLNKKDKCSFRVILDRQGGTEYLHVDGTNSMIGSKITFIESKGNAPLKCLRWSKNNNNKWEEKIDEDCGIGFYEDNNPVAVNIAVKDGTFTNIMLNKECTLYNYDSTTQSVVDSNKKTPCGILNQNGDIIQLVDNIHSKTGFFNKIYTNDIQAKDIKANNLQARNIVSNIITTDRTQVNNLFQSYNSAQFFGNTRFYNITAFDRAATFNDKTNFNNDLNINGNHLIKATSSKLDIKDMNVSNFAKIKNLNNENLTVENRLRINEYLQLNKKERINNRCKENGLITTSTDNEVLICQNHRWINALSTTYKLIWSGSEKTVYLPKIQQGEYKFYFSDKKYRFNDGHPQGQTQLYISDEIIKYKTTIHSPNIKIASKAYEYSFSPKIEFDGRRNSFYCDPKPQNFDCRIYRIYYKSE